jgi:hypothetical protein
MSRPPKLTDGTELTQPGRCSTLNWSGVQTFEYQSFKSSEVLSYRQSRASTLNCEVERRRIAKGLRASARPWRCLKTGLLGVPESVHVTAVAWDDHLWTRFNDRGCGNMEKFKRCRICQDSNTTVSMEFDSAGSGTTKQTKPVLKSKNSFNFSSPSAGTNWPRIIFSGPTYASKGSSVASV